MIARITRGRETGRGQSLVEFALAIPVFFMVLIGIAEGGYYVMATTMVNHATQEGTRLAILENTPNTGAVRSRVIQQATPATTLANGDITISVNGSSVDDAGYAGRVTGDQLRVQTTYAHTPLVGYIFDGLTFPANARSELWVE